MSWRKKGSNVGYSGDFSWKITNPSAVTEFLNAPPGTKFSSNIFTIGGLKWLLFAYPSGKYAYNKHSRNPIQGCELYLELISSSWPKYAYKIIFNYRLFCSNASSSFTNIHQFYAGHHVSWYKGTLTTNELEALEGQIINLQCYINILQIIGKDQKSIIYQFPYKINNKHIEFEWKIQNIDGLFINTKCGKHIESEIFNHFWCLRIAPKGWKLKEQKYVNLWLQLCCLPMNINKINVNYSILCVETNTYYNNNAFFDYNPYYKNVGWNQRKLVTNSLKKYDALTFQCKIEILKQFDINGLLINDGIMDKNDDIKSSEMDGLRQEVNKLNKKVSEMQKIINDLQLKISVCDEKKEDINDNSIVGMVKQMRREIELLKKQRFNGKDIVDKNNIIKHWFYSVVGLPEYYQLFVENGIEEMKVIKMLSIKELEALGIKMGHRLKILSAIEDLKSKDNNTFDGNNIEINEGHCYPSPGNPNYGNPNYI